MSAVFAAFSLACGFAIVFLTLATLFVATAGSPTNWMVLAILAWSTLAAVVFGTLFLLASNELAAASSAAGGR